MTAQDVLIRVGWEIGQNGEEMLFSSENAIVKQLKQIMFASGNDIAGRTEWQKLHKEWNIGGNQTFVDLPDDFREFQEGGAIRVLPADGTMRYQPVRLVTDPMQWDMLTARPSAQNYARISDGKLHFSNGTGSAARASYVSKYWNLNAGSSITAADETFAIPEDLLVRGMVWRWRRQKGLPFTDQQSEYEADLIEAVSADRGIA